MSKDFKLILTVEQSKDREKWLAVRRQGLGGSDAGTIMKLNPYKSRLTLWMEKTGQKAEDNLSDNQAAYWGTVFEEPIARWFCEQTGKKVRRCGTVQSTKHPWMLANMDREIVGEQAGLEVKTAGVKQYAFWKGDNIPDRYYCQIQHYMMVTGYTKWYLAALIGGNDAIIKEVPRNDKFIEELFAAEAGFWTLVENNIMPEIDGTPDTDTALTGMYPQAVDDSTLVTPRTAEIVSIIEDRLRFDKAINDLKEMRDECDNKLKALMGEREVLIVGDQKIATWKNVAGRNSLDARRLEKEMPDVYKKYLKTGKPTRRFTMVGGKENE